MFLFCSTMHHFCQQFHNKYVTVHVQYNGETWHRLSWSSASACGNVCIPNTCLFSFWVERCGTESEVALWTSLLLPAYMLSPSIFFLLPLLLFTLRSPKEKEGSFSLCPSFSIFPFSPSFSFLLSLFLTCYICFVLLLPLFLAFFCFAPLLAPPHHCFALGFVSFLLSNKTCGHLSSLPSSFSMWEFTLDANRAHSSLLCSY